MRAPAVSDCCCGQPRCRPSPVFSGDSRPNYFMLNNATNLDVLVHELTLSPDVWSTKNNGLHPGDPATRMHSPPTGSC